MIWPSLTLTPRTVVERTARHTSIVRTPCRASSIAPTFASRSSSWFRARSAAIPWATERVSTTRSRFLVSSTPCFAAMMMFLSFGRTMTSSAGQASTAARISRVLGFIAGGYRDRGDRFRLRRDGGLDLVHLKKAVGLLTYVVHLHLQEGAGACAVAQRGPRVVRVHVYADKAVVAHHQHPIAQLQHAVAHGVRLHLLAADEELRA